MDEELKEALHTNRLYDFIANEYYNLGPYQLKEICLAILGICYDKCCGDEDEEALMELIEDELHNRSYFDEDTDDEDSK